MRVLASLILLVSLPLHATSFEACPSTCTPPTGNVVLGQLPPYDAPVKFGSEVKRGRDVTWLWVRVGNPSKPCTTQQATGKDPHDPIACKVKVGEVLLATMPIRAKK